MPFWTFFGLQHGKATAPWPLRDGPNGQDGLLGMPRRVADYDPAFSGINLFISLAAMVLGASFLIFFYNAAVSLARGEKAPANPWGGRTLEWTVPSPPGHGNFATQPIVTGGPYDFSQPAQWFGPTETDTTARHHS